MLWRQWFIIEQIDRGARYRVGNCTNDAIIPTRHVQDNTWTAVVKPAGALFTLGS